MEAASSIFTTLVKHFSWILMKILQMKRPFWWMGLSFHRLDWKQLSFKESYIRVNRLIVRWDGICINPCSDTALNCAHGEIDWFTFIINATRFRRLARGLESLQNLHILPKKKNILFSFKRKKENPSITGRRSLATQRMTSAKAHAELFRDW